MDWYLVPFCDGGSQHHQNAYLECRRIISIAHVVTLGDRYNGSPSIRSGGVRQKFAAYCVPRVVGVVVVSLFEGLRGGCVRGVHMRMSVRRCRVNGWNVKGEMPLDHARVRDGAGVLDPVARRTRKRCL